MAPNMIYAPFICIQLLLCHCLLVQFSNVVIVSASTDTITEGQTLGLMQTLTSSGQVFELGFFSPQNSTNLYLGIWYKKIGSGTVVWVGNRDQPLRSSSPYLTLEQGNLEIIDDRITYRVSSVSSARNMSLVLLDSGNLVLIDRTSLDVIWQSFDDPTDTFLPGMKLGIDKRTGKVWSLTAWEKETDPTPGTASLKVNPQRLDEFIILKENETYWSSGSWDGNTFQNVPEMRLNYIFNFSFNSSEDISYFTYSLYDNYTSILSRCVLDISGQFQPPWEGFTISSRAQQSWRTEQEAIVALISRSRCRNIGAVCGKRTRSHVRSGSYHNLAEAGLKKDDTNCHKLCFSFSRLLQ